MSDEAAHRSAVWGRPFSEASLGNGLLLTQGESLVGFESPKSAT
jgi:hypothetical protein